MTHFSLVRTAYRGLRGGPKVPCNCEVQFAGIADRGGVEWLVYFCPWCSKLVYTVEGGPHRSNYEEDLRVAPDSALNGLRQRLRALLEWALHEGLDARVVHQELVACALLVQVGVDIVDHAEGRGDL
jgi:hypothetical protein